jgi:hypothetical protein
MSRWSGGVVASFLAVALAGCTIPVFTKPVTVSTSPIPGKTEHGGAKLVTGTSCSRLTLLIIPLGFGTSDAAFEDALAQAPGADTLVDWRMKQDVLAILATIIYFQSCVTVEGYAVDSSKLVQEAGDKAAARSYVSYWQERRTEATDPSTDKTEQKPNRAAGIDRKATGL